MRKGLNRVLSLLEILGDGFTVIPFGFTVNGTSDADGLKGPIASAVFAEAGEYLVTLLDDCVPAECYVGFAGISPLADDVDINCTLDWSTVVSAGQFTVRCMTGSTETTPTDDTPVGGFLLVRKTTR